jgi:hypothetical protein
MSTCFTTADESTHVCFMLPWGVRAQTVGAAMSFASIKNARNEVAFNLLQDVSGIL